MTLLTMTQKSNILSTNKRKKIALAFVNTLTVSGFVLAMLYLNNPRSFEEFWVIHLPEFLRGVVNGI